MQSASDAVLKASNSALAWLRNEAWPFWLTHGIDRNEVDEPVGFHEYLSLDDYQCQADFRRLRVVTRQIYVFSEALIAGVVAAEEAMMLGLAYLRRHAFDPEGGYHWRFNLRGGVIDPRRDLYDHAFVLLALSTAMRARPDPVLRAEAFKLDTYLHDIFPHPKGGYSESQPATLPRRQNPHMHLLEASLAAAEAFGDIPFLDRADSIVDLFLTRMLQQAEGALPEYFDEALAPHRENGRFLVEPGHHSEWVWLLNWHGQRRRAGGRPHLPAATEAIAMLNRFTDRYGIHPDTGAFTDLLWSDGVVASAGQRFWPQTERLKAEVLRPDANDDRILEAYAVLDRYIAPAPPGLWFEQRLPDGQFSDSPAPASSLYHITAAITVAANALRSRSI